MNILDKIVESKKEEVSKLKNEFTLSDFEDFTFFNSSIISFKEKLKENRGLSIIAEIKKASPSKGMIREDFNHTEIADIYMKNGADAVSVLTDENYFQGSITFVEDIARKKTAPLLRKDFLFDVIQVYQSKAYGADFILLISEILSHNQIQELSKAAIELGMEVLLEVHSSKELDKIDFELNDLIGINNRDLTTFNVDLQTTVNIADLLPDNVKIISESGFGKSENVDKVINTKVDGLLVGEHFMRSEKIGEELSKFQEWCTR